MAREIKHLDLFSGIGGFAYAIDQVWDDVEHVFCDIEPFCREILNKHWRGAKTYHDIRDITDEPADIVTGGFPCQPFSQAGKRRGTADNRYLWPEMFRVIQIAKPAWVIAENVRGLATWNDGLVLEQVCTDLEAEGYEVQPFIIPACAVNAPHRRERVWFIANSSNNGRSCWGALEQARQDKMDKKWETAPHQQVRERWEREFGTTHDNEWLKTATSICRDDDGIPQRVDRIKALGNAIVPQVAVEIFRAIKDSDLLKNKEGL